MFFIDNILWVNGIVVIGIIISKDIFNNHVDIVTFPSSRAFTDFNLTFTVSHAIIWTIFSSPFVFSDNNTIMNFTGIKHIITISITVI
jgi:hypothetical protein